MLEFDYFVNDFQSDDTSKARIKLSVNCHDNLLYLNKI